jgi:hypothetical protein
MQHAVRLILLIVIMNLGACAAKPQAATEPRLNSGRVAHVVVCWLKEAGNAEQRAVLIRESQKFMEIPGVVDVVAGEVMPSQRAVVDSTFDVAVVILFKSAAALEAYSAHPVHRQAVKEHLNPLVAKLLIYDAQEPTAHE